MALLVATLAAVGWMVWRPRSVAQAEPLGLTVLVNHAARVELTPGTPLFFETSITSSPSAGAIAIGSRWRPWHQLIRLEASGQTGMPWTLESAGPPRSLSVVRTRDGQPAIATPTEPSAVAHLEAGRQVYTVTEVASPEATAGVRPGAYRVRAVLETPWWTVWGWRGRKVSQPITVVVRNRSTAGDKRDALEKHRLERTAAFYLLTQRFDEAEKAARQLLAVDPDQTIAHVLLGDSLLGLKRRDEALVAYRRAMVLRPTSYEEPTRLMDRVQSAIDGARR